MTQKKNDTQTTRRHYRKGILQGVLSVLLLAYLVVSLTAASSAHRGRPCTGMHIAIEDTARLKFVTAAELSRELGSLPRDARHMRLLDIDTDSIETLLNSIDKIESATAERLTDGSVFVTVHPLHPVARVFDSKGSYYINRVGKRIGADARYHVDVPVIQGDFNDSVFSPTELLPLIDYIAADSLWNSLVSMIKVDSPTDIILVPIVRGQVINFGKPDAFESKFARIRRMYAEVLPVKGWSMYDTISVKWSGQIVATRRHKKLPEARIADDTDEEETDLSTMIPEAGVAPGQALHGIKAKDDQVIPAAKNKTH